ncbi:MAG: glycosyltransferase family 2 protein [Flavobacterium sp.]|nr:MAG: glycosyltransferase family 2 protein [Flavobacterium sp.]
MQLSVVILNYNVRFFLEQCVLSVQRAIDGLDAEIIVVDNNSPDDSVAMMRSRFPSIKLVANTENAGFPKGNNIGVAQAKGEYVCILNPDTVVAEDTFKKVLAFADGKADLGIVGVKLVDGTGKFLPESKRGIPTPLTAFHKITGLYKLSASLNKYYAAHLSENETGKVEILVGAFMLMKRDLYNEVGGFDENCFMYSDDIDLSYMVLKTGRSNYYFHATSVIHYKGESTVKDAQYMKRFREAMDFFYKKHFRVSFVFDVFMKTGAYFFSIFKKSQTGIAVKPSQYVLISENTSLKEAIERKLGKTIPLFKSSQSMLMSTKQKIEFIFDADFLDYKTIIETMESMSQTDATFKIAHADEGFCIGSNSSNDRGEVIEFTVHR